MESKHSTAQQDGYIAGWNMPGYMPEMEPVFCASFDDAQRFIIDSLKSQEDAYGSHAACADEHTAQNEAAAETFSETAEDVNLRAELDDAGEMTTDAQPDGYVYWIMPCPDTWDREEQEDA